MPEKPAGPRNITDLKARLGLKKPQAAAPAPTAPAPGQVPAPVPPPPGFQPPPGALPPQPAAPDLTRDPFAVQVQRAPVQPKVDFVVPEKWEAGGGTAVKKKSPVLGYVIYAAVAIIPLVVGYACGRINGGREIVNLTIQDAKKIRTEVQEIAKTNTQIEVAFDGSMNRQASAARSGQAPAVPDMKLVDELKALNLVTPVTDNLFRTNYYHMKDLAIERLFAFYYNTVILYERVNRHVRYTKRDQALLERYSKQSAASREKLEQTFGIIVDPSGPIPLGKLVMAGDIICKDEAEKCPHPKDWEGVMVRSDQNVAPSKRSLRATKDTERVVLLDKTPLFSKVIVGSPEALAAEAYGRRLREIKEVVEKLKPARTDLLKELDDQAKRKKLFHL